MGEGLRKVAERLAAMAGLRGKESEVIREAQHVLEQQSRLLEPLPVEASGPRQSLRQPERAEIEGPLLPVEAIWRPLAVAPANDRLENEKRIGAVGILLLCYGVGAVIGPARGAARQ